MKLHILMSTYNGERYLREQIDSILSQDLFDDTYVEMRLVVRDDGSTDDTIEILDEYVARDSRICYKKGKNKGVVASFFELMQEVAKDVDYVALADQDDVWMPDKLSTAVKSLEMNKGETPLLYCGRCELVDEELKPIQGIFFGQDIKPSFGNALVENICTGCTAVFNGKLLHMVSKQYSDNIVMHDWWLYLVASCFGRVLYDETPHMYYRQHSNNTVGVQRGYLKEFIARVGRFKKNRYQISRQISFFAELCETWDFQMPEENAQDMELILDSAKSLGKRWELARKREVYRQRKGDNVIFKIIILSGTL